MRACFSQPPCYTKAYQQQGPFYYVTPGRLGPHATADLTEAGQLQHSTCAGLLLIPRRTIFPQPLSVDQGAHGPLQESTVPFWSRISGRQADHGCCPLYSAAGQAFALGLSAPGLLQGCRDRGESSWQRGGAGSAASMSAHASWHEPTCWPAVRGGLGGSLVGSVQDGQGPILLQRGGHLGGVSPAA